MIRPAILVAASLSLGGCQVAVPAGLMLAVTALDKAAGITDSIANTISVIHAARPACPIPVAAPAPIGDALNGVVDR